MRFHVSLSDADSYFGPKGDHTTGLGHYLHVSKDKSHTIGDVARLAYSLKAAKQEVCFSAMY